MCIRDRFKCASNEITDLANAESSKQGIHPQVSVQDLRDLSRNAQLSFRGEPDSTDFLDIARTNILEVVDKRSAAIKSMEQLFGPHWQGQNMNAAHAEFEKINISHPMANLDRIKEIVETIQVAEGPMTFGSGLPLNSPSIGLATINVAAQPMNGILGAKGPSSNTGTGLN